MLKIKQQFKNLKTKQETGQNVQFLKKTKKQQFFWHFQRFYLNKIRNKKPNENRK